MKLEAVEGLSPAAPPPLGARGNNAWKHAHPPCTSKMQLSVRGLKFVGYSRRQGQFQRKGAPGHLDRRRRRRRLPLGAAPGLPAFDGVCDRPRLKSFAENTLAKRRLL